MQEEEVEVMTGFEITGILVLGVAMFLVANFAGYVNGCGDTEGVEFIAIVLFVLSILAFCTVSYGAGTGYASTDQKLQTGVEYSVKWQDDRHAVVQVGNDLLFIKMNHYPVPDRFIVTNGGKLQAIAN